MEASLRAPFLIRWPGKIQAGRVSNEIVHILDLFTTLAHIGGAEIPKDRPVDGVDQREFFLGKQEKSNREGFIAYVSDRLHAVKWRNWKMHLYWQVNMFDPPLKLPLPKLINLLTDLKEEHDDYLIIHYNWVAHPMTKLLNELEDSLKKYPPIPMGTPDPYHPPHQAR
jgi:arylsulfatase A-like enzyme